MARSGQRLADLRARRPQRSAMAAASSFSAAAPEPELLARANRIAEQTRSGELHSAREVIRRYPERLRTGAPALTIVEDAVLERYAADRDGEVVEGFARCFFLTLGVERRDSRELALAAGTKGKVIHVRRPKAESELFTALCGRELRPSYVRRGCAAAAQLPPDLRPLGMACDLCKRCEAKLEENPLALEPLDFRVLTATERRALELAALAGFAAPSQNATGTRANVEEALADALREAAFARMLSWSGRDYLRHLIGRWNGIDHGFFKAYGQDPGSWPLPGREELALALTGIEPLKLPDERVPVRHGQGQDMLRREILPVLLAGPWQEALQQARLPHTEWGRDEIEEILRRAGREL